MAKYTPSDRNFVAPLPEYTPRVELVQAPHELPTAPQTILMPHAGYEDRSRGFVVATAPLSIVVGFVVALVAIIGWQVPIASLVTLLLALGGFALVWLLAYLGHVFISPDGALFAHTVMMWGYLRREQRERHSYYRRSGNE